MRFFFIFCEFKQILIKETKNRLIYFKLGLENAPETSLYDLIEVVQQTIDDFRDKPCQIGRARIFQDKSIGLDDPGMVAFKRLLEGLDSN